MTWVKICGITNLEDARLAVEAGADAVGFVFHEKSPRKVDVETARAIVADLPGRVEKVGVFVEQVAEEIRGIAKRAGFTAVQVHGMGSVNRFLAYSDSISEGPEAEKLIVGAPADQLLREGFVMSEDGRKKTFAVLIDSGSVTTPGGTGQPFDWGEMRGIVQGVSFIVPVIVAGGLKPTNVSEAIGLFQPFGVDVASGVEAQPGKKDPEKVRAFVRAVRDKDQKAE